jgi:hypothetical protein
MINNQKDLKATLEKILSSISDDYYMDLYLPAYTPVTGIDLSKRKELIENTIKTYKKHHECFEDQRIKLIIDDLFEIVKKDEVVSFDNTLIYKELYKILFHFDQTFEAQKLLNDPKLYPVSFAKIQTDLKKVNSFRSHNKKNLVGSCRLVNRKESRLKYWLTTLYFHNRPLTKFFLHIFLLADLAKVSALYEDEEASKIILEDLDYFLMQQTTIGAVIKSLSILLYKEMNHCLDIDTKHAEIHTQSIIYILFKETVNDNEFEKHIILKSSLGFFPIFGSAKKSNLKGEEERFIKRQLLKDMIPIDTRHFDIFFDTFMKKPHIQYLAKYPVELFRQNPKYFS